MTSSASSARVFFLGNPDKPRAARALDGLAAFAADRCEVVGTRHGLDPGTIVNARPDRIVVLGGDGTLIGVARSLGSRQIPLIGVNAGKLGFLAEFSVAELRASFDRAVSDDGIISRRTVLQVGVQHDGGVRDTSIAINDCVIQAGPPFRIIELGVDIDGDHLTHVIGDGLIICTPSGSTAHNLSAGGPILDAGVDAMVMTPLCPHSLTHKPIVFERESVIEIHAKKVNGGTTAIIDGQVSFPLLPGDRVCVRRFGADFLLVRNPAYARWHNLVTKLQWGRAPTIA